MTTVKQESNYRQARLLRALADWIEDHPDTNMYVVGGDTQYSGLRAQTKQELAAELKSIGPFAKTPSRFDKDFHFVVPLLDDFSITFYTSNRELVCTKKIVGYEDVPEETVPAKVVPAHKREIVEWECDGSVLNPWDHPRKTHADENSVDPQLAMDLENWAKGEV